MSRRNTITVSEIKHTWNIHDSLESLSGPACIVNQFVDLCPAGMLPLSSGLISTGYIPAVVLLVVFAAICTYTMYTIGKAADVTREKTFRAQWEVTIGKRSSWVPVLTVIFTTAGCSLAYSCMFADLMAQALPWLRIGTGTARSSCLFLFTALPLLPLCMLKDLSALAYGSFFGLLAVLYTVIIMVIRSVDGSYAQGGRFFASLSPQPAFPNDAHLLDFGPQSLALVNFLAMGFLVHYNGCKYYRELERPTATRFVRLTGGSMSIVTSVYIVVMIAGYRTFGRSCSGVILQNYSPDDSLALVASFSMALAIIASAPLMFSGLREAVIELMGMMWPHMQESLELVSTQNMLTCTMLAKITVCAWLLTDTGKVVGLVGATCGSATIYVIPTVLYASSLQQLDRSGEHRHGGEIMLATFVACFGVAIGCLGVGSVLSA